MNPAFAGADGNGKIRLNSLHRNIFRPIKGPFNSTTFSLDYGLCSANIGIGFIASNESQGDGFLYTNKFDFVFSKLIQINRYNQLSAGINFGFIFQNLDWSKYTFSDQYDPIFGNVRPSVNSSLISDFSNAVHLNLGLNYTGWKRNKRMSWNAGIAGNNLITKPQLGYINSYILPQRYTVYGGLTFHSNPALISNSLRFFSRFDLQTSYVNKQAINKTNILMSEYYLNNNVNLGIGIRTSFYNISGLDNINSTIFSMGLQPVNSIKIIMSYEQNITAITTAATFELGFIWIPDQELCAGNGLFNLIRGRSGRGRGGFLGLGSGSSKKRIGCTNWQNDKREKFIAPY
jgi:type IX secretion system PorP/SprF family membrane protein